VQLLITPCLSSLCPCIPRHGSHVFYLLSLLRSCCSYGFTFLVL
jgi:hypothetical protein